MSTDLKKWTNLQTIRRLPMYYHFLKKMRADGREFISSATIAKEMALEPIVVRKDLAIERNLGKPRVGYRVDDLVEMIEHFLGWDNTTHAFLVGAGNLGSALLGYGGMANYGLEIVAAFDTDENKIGRSVHNIEVQPLDRLIELGRRLHVKLGIVCVPPAAAQRVVNLMVSAGIQGIWNFTPTQIQVPDDVIVEREDLASGLAMLSYKLPRRNRVDEEIPQRPLETPATGDTFLRNEGPGDEETTSTTEPVVAI